MNIIVGISEAKQHQFIGRGAYNGKESPIARSNRVMGSRRVEPSRRPSPFGPAIALLPENHQLPQVDERTSVADALRVMFDHRFSQLAVMDSANCIRGIFSFRTLSARVLDLQDANIDLSALPVSECLEPAKYLPADDFIDTSIAADFRRRTQRNAFCRDARL